MKQIKLILLSIYILAGFVAGGHFYANEDSNAMQLGEKPIACVAVVMFNPIYWSYVYFKGKK